MKLTQLALCVITVATTAFTTPVTAQSLLPQDFAFLEGVNKRLDPLLSVSDQQKMADGRTVCQQLKTGQVLGDLIAEDFQSLKQQPFTVQQPTLRYYRAVKEYGIRSYCPEFSYQWRTWYNALL
jgi:hypothetical protein